MNEKHICPVCGFSDLKEKPRTQIGGGSYEICPSCGFQFGVSDDDDGFTYAAWRERWREQGMKWSSHQKPPRSWNAQAQLATLARRKI